MNHGFSELSLRGLRKTGDIIVPGDSEFPSFSDSGFTTHFHRMSSYMNEDDREGLKLLTSLLGIAPKPVVKLILHIASLHAYFPGPIGSIFRQIHIGLRGVVFTLYYSDLDDGEILRLLNYKTNINTFFSEDTEMEHLLNDRNPILKSFTLSPVEAFERARASESTIAELSLEKRIALVDRVREVVLKRQEEIVEIIQQETNKARTDIITSELFPLFEHLDFIRREAKKALQEEKVPTPIAMMGKASRVWFEPLGTILVISPWNYPFYQAIVPITCAFVTGNASVYKPSELTPLRGLVESILKEAGFEDQWVSVVYGDGKIGSDLIEEKPQKIFFTGSVGTGKKIMAQAARHLIPVELELGGKDPMIVFEDVNLDRAVKGAVWGAFTNSGQSCTSVERLYIQDSIYSAFKEKLVEETRKLKLGVDKDGDSDIGEMISDRQVQIVADLVKDSIAQGATLLTGSDWDFTSKMIPPMVIEGTTHDMRINQEEIFGPVLPLMKFKTEAEAIKLANDSSFGLSASVWSKDKERALRVSRRIVTGNVSINNVMVSEGNHDLPFGGVKDSGIGRYKGAHGLRSFCNIKSVLIDGDSSKIEANWYPYTTKKYSLLSGLIQRLFGGGIGKWVGLVTYGLPLESEAKKERT